MGLPSTIFPELAQEPDKAPESPITEDILDRVRRVESGGGKYLVSPKGALGPYQIMPATAAEYGINPMQESDARETARRILEKNYIKYGDLNLALMAYHAGQGNIDRYLAGRESGVGPLTLSYPEKVMGAPVAASSLSTKSDDKAIFPELQQASTDKIFPDLIPAPGAFSAEAAPEKKTPQKGGFMRGLETQFEQTKALAPGLVGLVGATGEAAFGEGGTWSDLKNWGLTGYQTRMKSIEEKAAETDDVLKAWEKAKQGDLGALLEWGKFGLGYLAGNIGEAVITGGVGSLVGKAAFKYAGEGVLRGMVAKEAAKLAEKEAAGTGVALGAKELAERAAAPELIEAATRNVAGRVGSIAALAGTNIAKETGSIYGEAEEEAEKKGKKLNGADLARIWGSGLVAGLSEAAVDRLGLDIAGGRLKIPGTGRVGSAMVGSVLGAGVEGAQEFLQTAIERYGAAKELSGSDAYRDYINSVALGALGGGTVGGVIGAFRGKGISREEAEAALKAAQEELNAKAEEAGKVLGTDAETVRAANDILLALPPPEKGKYGPDYGFTRRGEREGEGVDIVRTPEERIEEFRRQQKVEAEAPVETPAEPRRIGFEPFDEEGALRGEGFTMRGAEEDVAPVPQEEFKPAGLIETRIRDVEPLPPREVAEIRLSELSDGDRVTKAWLSEQTGEKGKSLDSLWMDLIGDKFLRREGNKFVRNAPEEQPEATRAQTTPKPVEPEPAPELVETDLVAEPAAKETLLGPLGKKPPTPRNILDWIADTGGIWDVGGELKAMDLHLYKKPGQKKLIVGFGDPRQIDIDPLARKAVRDLDKVTSEAIQAKYLPEEAGPNDLLEAMRATRAGRPVYSSLDYNDAQALQEWNDLKADKEEERNKIEQDASLYGIKTEGKSLSTLLKEIAEAEAKVSKKERQSLAGSPRKAIDAARALDEKDIPFSRDVESLPTPSKLLRQEKISDTLITEDFENPQTREEQKVRVSRAMKDALAHVLGPGVDVRVVDQVLGKWDGQWHPAGGAFDPVEKVIALSMESPNIERAAFHEAIHFLREANVISDADWKLLSEQADKWKDKAYKSTWEKYADKKNETRTEEVIADAFSDWRNGRLDVPNPILRIFHKILDFVQRLKKKIGYEGARSWKDVFTDIESGRYRDLAGQYHMTEMARDGSFALVDSRTARAVGNYQTKKAAITAALDIEAAQNASLRLQRESAIAVDDAATKVAAKHSVDQMIGIAQRKAMFSRMPSLESEATYLTNWWGKAILPVAMAAKDRIFARVWNVVNDRERFTSRIYQDYFSPLRGLSNLSAQEKTNVYKAAVAARMDGIDVKPSKSNVTIKYKGTDDIIDHTTNKVWLKSGETISLNSKETESFFALKNAFKNVWADLNDAAAIKAGFPMDGNIKELRDAAVGDSAKKAIFLQKYKNIPGIDKILGSMTAGIYQERAGYIPFQRYGSVIIAVTRKGAKKGDAPLATVLVDADSADMPSVKKARKELEDRYGAVGDVQEPRLVSENDYSGAAMEEMEHLISQLERAAGRDKGDLYKAYIEKVADEFKRGWQRKSRNVLGFSTDFEKVIPEYLSNAAQTNGRMRYANAIDRQMREINNPRGGTPADGVPSKSVRDFTNKWLNYVDNPSNDFSTTRKVGFLWYLWGNLSSAVVNLSQTPLVTLPVVAKWGMNLGQSIAEATKIANLFFSRKVWYMQDGRILLDVDKMNFLSDAEKRAVKGWQQSGLLQNQITNDQAGLGYVEKISNKAVMRNIEKVFQAGASPFALAETINRLTAGLIAYRSALKTGALDKAIKVYEKNQAFQDRFDGGKTLTPEKMAAWTIEETQFFGGKVNTSEMMRGIGSVAFQFKNYTANYLNLMYRSFANEGREGKMAGLAMLAGLMLVSGLRGIPFEGDLEQLLNWITETVTGINPNINMQLKEFARKGLMGAGLPEEQAILGASLMMNGLSRLTSVDLGSRFGQGDIVPNDVNSLFGPVVSAFSVAADGISHVKNGQTFQGTARLVPKAFGNVIESLGYTDQGIKTKAGNEVMGPNEFSTADQIVKALGFQPTKLAERQEIAYDLTQVSEQARKAAGGMARYLANMVVRAENARARGDMEAAEEAMQNYAERLRRYEREMSDPDRPAYMQYKINRDAIKKEIRNALDWRMRFLGGKKMARPEIIEILRRSGESIGA